MKNCAQFEELCLRNEIELRVGAITLVTLALHCDRDRDRDV